MATLLDSAQNPLRALGLKSQEGAVGVHRIFFTGSTGTISTGYGIPGITGTRLSTGTYRIRFPSTKAVYINPSIAGTSGTYYGVNVQNVNGISGIAEIQVSKGGVAQTPATGTYVELWFFVTPVSSF